MITEEKLRRVGFVDWTNSKKLTKKVNRYLQYVTCIQGFFITIRMREEKRDIWDLELIEFEPIFPEEIKKAILEISDLESKIDKIVELQKGDSLTDSVENS